MPNGQVKSQGPGTASRKALGRHVSAESTPVVPHGTVEVKASPAKNIDGQATPDWKRRVLKENQGKGDLFSPIGLESIFRPPTIGSKQKTKTVFTKKKPSKEEHFPSSPPQYPALSRHRVDSPDGDPKKVAIALSPRSELSEKEGSSRMVPQEIEPPSTMGRRTERVSSANIRPSGLTSSNDEIAGRTPALPTAPTPPQLGAYDRTSPGSASNGANHSQISSVPDKASDENISPFYVSRHNTVDGRVEYAAIDMSMRRLRSQMDKLRMQQQNIPSSRSSDHDIDYADSRLSGGTPFEQLNDLTSQSLPDDLSMGTDAYAANGGFVSIHRGGYSNDGSFQRRPLSPSLLQDLDGQSLKSQTPITHDVFPSPKLPEKFSQTKSSTPSSPPKTPRHQKNDSGGSHERPRSSGSPLKLFDKYDTFTNDRLARRMSKFEETLQQELQDNSSAQSVNARSSPSPGPRRRLQRSQHQQEREVERGRRITSFGSNDLNNHQFPTYEASGSHAQDADSPGLPQSDPGEFMLERSHPDRPAGADARNSRKLEVRGSHGDGMLHEYPENGPRATQAKSTNEHRHQVELRQHDVLQTSTGKRLPYSPAKDPAPKRRRTLRNSEEMDKDIAQLRQQLETNAPPVSMTGRKRKDALYNTDKQVADPKVLAMRQIRQPRLPASSPVNSPAQQMISRKSDYLPQPAQLSEHNQGTASAVDPPTQIVAGALATVALNTVQDITYGSRKASVTTADFFNEAQQIMQLIRNQGRPRSSHTTADGSELGQPIIAEESAVEDSTKDEFSRPPSREGGSPPRLRIPVQTDARVISHLRKFEDQETLGLAISSSLKTLQIGQTGKNSENNAPEHVECDPRSGTESDPPNIRIRESDVQSHKRNYSSSTHDLSILGSERHSQSKDSQLNSGPSTSRSNPTTSSRSSANRLVIAPETVAHLLSDQMAGMVFDRQKQMWIKRKGSANVEGSANHDHTVSDGTEEDLFGDIPDLSVDEMEELKRVKESISSVRTSGSEVNNISSHDQAMITQAVAKVVDVPGASGDARPKTADGKMIEAVEDSSAPSKCSHFAWSGPQPGTRATSWGEEALPSKGAGPVSSTNPNDQHEAEVEHEISILEGRESRVPRHQSSKHRQARVVTVAFSSPLVEQREPAYENDDEELDLWEGQSNLSPHESPVRQNQQPSLSSSRTTAFGVAHKPGRRNTSRRMSFSNQSYHARPMSRLDEQDELSLVQYSGKCNPMTLEVAVSTPLPVSRSLMVPPTTGDRSSVSFHLSPLPDFTVHQIDRPLDGRLGQVTRRPKQIRTNQADNRLSLAAQDMVKNLTDVEPYEPYWDYIRSVDLHDRELKTLHMLDEFCGGVEGLDVSYNQIGELNGIPSTVRRLNIRGNCLSDLAAWNSLYNLQYIDISENSLQSVKGLHNLVHLRGLRADHNEIRSLNGLEDLDGLISLSLRGNILRAVDFRSFNLYVLSNPAMVSLTTYSQRLTDLDLRDNELIQVSNLDQLASLKTCNLSKLSGVKTFLQEVYLITLGCNDLETLDICKSSPLSNLETLNVSNNCLSFLEIAAMPKLKILDIDNNSVAQFQNLNHLKQLETLSWREQRLDVASSLSEIQYNDCYEVRNLCVSGNPLSDFAPSTPFLNLHHLELASTGLQMFPPDFGLQCPNVRILNANYNAIHDLRPLLGIVKMEKLFLAGNRVSRLRRTAAVLDRVASGLLEVDLRNNPLTVGFYTPQEPAREEKRVVPHGRITRTSDGDAEHDLQIIRAYLLPAIDKAADNLSRERLDEDTKLRRRVYEMLVVNGCKTLEKLDGLEVDREMVGKRDDIWERLIELGVLKVKGGEDGKMDA